MKIEEIRNKYNISVNSQKDHLKVLDYLKSLGETTLQNSYLENWNKICFHISRNSWVLLSNGHKEYNLPSLTFQEFKDLLNESEKYLPDGHPDKLWKPKFKVGDKFEGILNNHVEITEVGKTPKQAYKFGTNTEFDTEEYVNTLTQIKQKLVFGLFDIGDIVVSLEKKTDRRTVGDMFKVLPDSTPYKLWYKSLVNINSHNSESFSWRLATPDEVTAYNNGITNINNITKMSKADELLEEAKRKYPVGTKFNSPNSTASYAINQVVEVAEFKWYNKTTITVKQTSKNSEGIVYREGQWAEVVSTNNKTMFEKDEYIVLLKGGKNTNINIGGYRENCCYKQKLNGGFLTYLDSDGDKGNAWAAVKFDNPSGTQDHGVAWRYATKEEIAEYDRLGKPYNVTTLNSKPKTSNPIVQGIEMIPGDIYFYNYIYIFEFDSASSGDIYNVKNEINTLNNTFKKSDSWWLNINGLKKATPEQIEHWKLCVKAGEYVEPKSNNTNNTTMNPKQQAELALARLLKEGFKKGCEYVSVDNGIKDIAECDPKIEEGSINSYYIDCGQGYLWRINDPNKFAILVSPAPNSSNTDLKVGDTVRITIPYTGCPSLKVNEECELLDMDNSAVPYKVRRINDHKIGWVIGVELSHKTHVFEYQGISKMPLLHEPYFGVYFPNSNKPTANEPVIIPVKRIRVPSTIKNNKQQQLKTI